MRLFLALWLAVFAVQTTDLVALVAPDECTERSGASAPDDCRDGCLRCVCCARVPVFEAHSKLPAGTPAPTITNAVMRIRPVPDPGPRAIYHVPKVPRS